MAFTAADVPDKIDLLLNGEAYMFAEREETRAQLGITSTFVPRYAVNGDYGDQTQDFFFTTNTNDWSLGEGQKFFRRDEDRKRRYWRGQNVDITIPGQVSLARAAYNVSSTFRSLQMTTMGTTQDKYATFSTTKIYSHDLSGGEIDLSTHGLGTTPQCITHDGDNLYVSADTVSKVRKYDIGGTTYSDFSTTQGARQLCFLNNTLFGWDQGNQKLFYYDSSGVATTVFQWKDADGNVSANGGSTGRMVSYGGKIMLLLTNIGAVNYLYSCDTTGASTVAKLPPGFQASAITSAYGAVFISGNFAALNGASRSGILVYDNGSLDTLWRAAYTGSTAGGIAGFSEGLVFTDDLSRAGVYYYDLTSGSVSTLFEGLNTVSSQTVVGGLSTFELANGTSGHYIFPSDTTLATSGYVQTSLDDFDSSLTKIFRGVTVDYVAGSGGNGGSVDIAYRIGDVDGSYTSLQTGAASGTEYDLSSQTGKAISFKVTINKGTATTPPILKKISYRAVPKQAAYRRDTYVLALGGKDGMNQQQLRDSTFHPYDGMTQATNLRTVALAGTPVTIVDQFGSYTGVIDNENLQIRCYAPEEFVAVVPVREV